MQYVFLGNLISILLRLEHLQPVAKRRVALFRNLTRPNEAIHALTELLKSTPTDIEAWAELAELYFSHGAFSQATFCFEEILLVAPNAWNVSNFILSYCGD